jgi:hypothetical protein
MHLDKLKRLVQLFQKHEAMARKKDKHHHFQNLLFSEL